jgi:hypothetical protein
LFLCQRKMIKEKKGNYRLVSIICIISKIFERLVYDQNLLFEFQSCFRSSFLYGYMLNPTIWLYKLSLSRYRLLCWHRSIRLANSFWYCWPHHTFRQIQNVGFESRCCQMAPFIIYQVDNTVLIYLAILSFNCMLLCFCYFSF